MMIINDDVRRLRLLFYDPSVPFHVERIQCRIEEFGGGAQSEENFRFNYMCKL